MPKSAQVSAAPPTPTLPLMVAKIATGEPLKSGRVKSGKAGAKARAAKLSAVERSEIAKTAAAARWK